MSRAWLALGGNLGDREAFLRAAREGLEASDVHVQAASRILETEPIGVTSQPLFLNQVLLIRTDLEPRPLLDRVKQLERLIGRQPRARWGPREIDIDILRYEDRIVEEPGLRIPHPELGNRPFLLSLLEELAGTGAAP